MSWSLLTCTERDGKNKAKPAIDWTMLGSVTPSTIMAIKHTKNTKRANHQNSDILALPWKFVNLLKQIATDVPNVIVYPLLKNVCILQYSLTKTLKNLYIKFNAASGRKYF